MAAAKNEVVGGDSRRRKARLWSTEYSPWVAKWPGVEELVWWREKDCSEGAGSVSKYLHEDQEGSG